jgi:hypothetical protein
MSIAVSGVRPPKRNVGQPWSQSGGMKEIATNDEMVCIDGIELPGIILGRANSHSEHSTAAPMSAVFA